MKIVCPECEAENEHDKIIRGDLVKCPDCGVELEITKTEPLMLELVVNLDDYGE
jgi:lysine biosynthesis protein LysW